MMALHLLLSSVVACCTLPQDEVSDAVCRLCHDEVVTPASADAETDGAARIHADVECTSCHVDLLDFDMEEMEHELPVSAPTCAACHAEVERHLRAGAHGRAGTACWDCHGAHEPRSFHAADRALLSGRINALCASCHSDLIASAAGDLHSRAFEGRTCLACHDPHDAQRPEAPEADRGCLVCHGGSGGPDPPSATRDSAHGAAGVSCVLCHVELQHAELSIDDDPPHPMERSGVRCGSCHPGVEAAWGRGVHSGTLGNGHTAAGCTDCHAAHGVLPAEDPRSTVAPRRLPTTCETCHRPSPPEAHPAPAGEKVQEYESSIHGRLLLQQGLVVSATCSSCHGSHEIHAADDLEAATSRKHVPYTCGACHAGVLEGYLSGVHGADFLSGGQDVPVCTDCHSEHAIEDPALDESSVSQGRVAATCARCHGDDALADRYGLESTAIVSWGRSYHGIAAAFGAPGPANCASCHGFHAILPSSDPRSRVNPANLQATCGGCHVSAGAAFARVPVHSVIDRDTNFVPWLVRTVYAVLVAVLIGGFALLVLVDLFGRLRLRLGWGPPETEHIDAQHWPDEDALVPQDETFVRMGGPERVQHALLIVSFVLLVLTGLPVFLHDSALMRSVIDLEGGYLLRSTMHRIGAVLLIGLSLWHVAAVALSPKARTWFGRMMLRPRDFTDFFQEVMFNLGAADWLSRRRVLRPFFERHPKLAFRQRPCLGRYGLVERLEYGAVLWGNLVMVATGAILWRPDWFLGWTPTWTFDVCRVIHGFEATLAFLAIIIWHMYHVHLRPEVFPMSRTWLTGRISRREMRHHHPREYQRILAERRRAVRGSSQEIRPGASSDAPERQET